MKKIKVNVCKLGRWRNIRIVTRMWFKELVINLFDHLLARK